MTDKTKDVVEMPAFENMSEEAAKKDTAKELIEMEQELDETMRKIRKRLMIIRLISLMSEDDQLQEAMMNNSSQKIEFLMSTIHRAVVMCQSRQKAKKEKADSGGDILNLVNKE